MIRYIVFLLAVPLSLVAMANQTSLDSLKNQFHQEKNDSSKMRFAYKIGGVYFGSGQSDSCIRYTSIAIDLAKQLQYDPLIHNFSTSLAQIYTRVGNKEMALAFADSALAIAKRNDHVAKTVETIVLKGDIHSRFGNSAEAISAFKNALNTAAESNLASWMATSFNNLSIEYQKLGDEETSIEYLIQSIEIREKENSKYLGTSYANLANAYKRQERFDKAVDLYEKALVLLEDDAFTDNRIICLRNLGDTYTRLGQYEKAKRLLKKSYDLVLSKVNDPIGRAMYFFLSSTIYQEQGLYDSVLINGTKVLDILGDNGLQQIRSSNLINMANASLSLALTENSQRQMHMNKAIEYGEQAIDLARQINSHSQISKVSKVLMKIYGQASNASKTLEYAELYGNSLDSLNKIEQNKKVVAMQTKFDVEKKEFQIDLLQKETELAQSKIDEAARENRAQLYYIVLIGLALIIFIVFAALLYRQVKLKNRVNTTLSAKNLTISQQNEEKELLLKEIHHRVKNNLQVVSSLLDLQSKKVGDSEKEALAEGQGRVRAMALIHEKLYQSKTVSAINFEEYCTQLSQQIGQLFPNGQNVDCEIDVVNISLDIDTAVPVGLILNELITNAHKYAFPTGEGRLRISAEKDEQNTYILRVEDNGQGLPDDFDWRKSKSLGLRLVNRLARQLYGKAEYSKGEKSTFEITFKDTLERKKIA